MRNLESQVQEQSFILPSTDVQHISHLIQELLFLVIRIEIDLCSRFTSDRASLESEAPR